MTKIPRMNRVVRRHLVQLGRRSGDPATALRFHAVSRHDGMASVLRGFTADELVLSVKASTGHRSVVRRHLGYRLTATWAPTQ